MRWRTMARICYACKGTSTPCPDSYCNGLIKVIVMFSDWSTAWPCFVDKKRGQRWSGESLRFGHKTSVFYFFKSTWKNQVWRTGFLVYFELDLYCLCSLQKSILKFLKIHFISLIFQTLFFKKVQMDRANG